MRNRYESIAVAGKAWNVRDTDAKKYSMPMYAMSMNVLEKAAKRIADILNHEWHNFLNKP
jgi:hypothetical protein